MEKTYKTLLPYWKKARDAYDGEDNVKSLGVEYLAMTAGMQKDYDAKGKRRESAERRYNVYLDRAKFPAFTNDNIDTTISVLYREPSVYNTPKQFDYLIDNASSEGESLSQVNRNINFEQLLTSRCLILLDFDKNGIFHISFYYAENIVNFKEEYVDKKKRFVYIILDETPSEKKMTSDDLNVKDKYRILGIKDGRYYQSVSTDSGLKDFFDYESYVPKEDEYITFTGNKSIDEIPAQIINAQDIKADYQLPVNRKLINLDFEYYKDSADYKLNLHMQSMDTLFLAGVSEDELSTISLGAGGYIRTDNDNAKIGFAGVSDSGIQAQEKNLENIENRAKGLGFSLVEKGSAESGNAIQTRLDIKTTRLVDIVLTGAYGLEKLLRLITKWTGQGNEDEWLVMPNLDFFTKNIDPQLLSVLMEMKREGNLSSESIHNLFIKYNLTELDFDTEIKKLLEEQTKLKKLKDVKDENQTNNRNIEESELNGRTTEITE